MSADHDPFEIVRARLVEAKAERGGVVARCPAHEDKHPSLRLSRGEDGRALVCCRAGCPTEAVVAALGLRMADLMPREAAPPPRLTSAATGKPRLPEGEGFDSAEAAAQVYRRSVCKRDGEPLGRESARWAYTNAAGEAVAVVLRWDNTDGTKRDIRPVSRFGSRWHLRAPDDARPLYRMDDLGGGGPVFVTEGEKAADAVASLGVTATTSMGGAQAAAKSCWESLAGREVLVLPDEDDAGARYAAEVRARCEALSPPAKVRVIRLPGLVQGSGEDAVEWIGRVHGGNREAARKALEALAADAPRPKPSGGFSLAELAKRPDALKPPPCFPSGYSEFDAAQPWGAVALGSLVTVGGEVGAGKSRFLLNLALGYARRGLRVAIMLGEMDEKQSLRRAVCALAEVPFKALRNPTEEQQGKLEKAREQLERLENLEFVRPGAGLSEMREWAAWAQILFLDPLQTMADGYPQPAEHERITALMRELVALCAEGLVVFASSEIGQGNGEARDLSNAFKGSGSIKQYSTALYFGSQPDELRVQVFKCFKQREGEKVPLKVQIRPGWQGISFLPKPSKGDEDE